VAESALPRPRPALSRGLRVAGLAWLPIALAVTITVALFFGAASIPPAEIVQILGHKLGLYSSHVSWSPGDENIVWDIRLPRVVAAALVGACLAVAGTLFQAVLRNPLADPYVIGTSAGAQLGVTIALVLPVQISVLGFGTLQAFAFLGALGTVLFVYALARTGSGTPVVTLILAGFVMSSFLISATSFLMVTGSRMNQVLTWTLGGIQVNDWGQLGIAFATAVASCLLACLLAPRLDAILLGEETASYLGVRVERLKLATIVLASFVTALAVTLAGVVAFVGLIVPHAARLIYGPGHRVLVPVAACAGAIFVVAVDVLARTLVAPTELPLGVMTAIVGAPFFLYLLHRGRRDYSV
jgi:iron complex transport system permease protein